MFERYSRQTIIPEIGIAGQKRLNKSCAIIIGCGALGTVIASSLVRAGVGRVKIIDRDFIEYHNLQRQILFNEEDIKENLPKAIAAERHLKKVNSEIIVQGIVSDVNYANIEDLVRGADVILDGTDNLETRFLINDVSVKLKIPWIYGGAIDTSGMTMTIIPYETPCFRCIIAGENFAAKGLTCDTAGVISPAPWIVASLQAAEAIKILVGSARINRDLVELDVWTNKLRHLKLNGRRDDCPACGLGKFEFLEGKFSTRTTNLCGQNSVQVAAPGKINLSFETLAQRLRSAGQVDYNEFMLRFGVDSQEMLIFRDGRAIVKNTNDEIYAKAFYTRYVGT
jgi:molybdopterin/thiamine biosynthesis adenylyltransferase